MYVSTHHGFSRGAQGHLAACWLCSALLGTEKLWIYSSQIHHFFFCLIVCAVWGLIKEVI